MSNTLSYDDMPGDTNHGEARCLHSIYEQYAPGIYRYIYRHIGDADQARDLQSEVFLRMLEGIDRYEERGWPIGAWLYRIAHDRAVDSLRRRERHQFQFLDDELAGAECPAEAAAKMIQRDELRAAIEQLYDAQRQVILLRFVYGLSLQETANQMGRTLSSVKALQHRAIEQLRRIMKVEEPER